MIRPTHTTSHQFNTTLCATLAAGMLAGLAALSASAPAQTALQNTPPSLAPIAGEESQYIGVIKGSGVYIRSGAGESYYPFGKLEDGALVKVTGERTGWAKIVASGPAFGEMFGYIKHAANDTSRLRLSADGKSATTLGKVDIIAPNLDARNEPKESWKSLVRLEADQTLHVLESKTVDNQTIHTVKLPGAAVGWVSMPSLRHASESEAAEFANYKPDQPAVASAKKAETGGTPPVARVAPNAPEISSASDATIDPAVEDSPELDPATAPVVATQPVEAPKPVEKPKLPTLEDLEAALKLLQKEPMATAEVGPLRELYLDLARRSVNEPSVARYASGRADHLQLWIDFQAKRAEVDAAVNRLKMSADEAEAVRLALERSAEYVIVGRIIASTIYDGQSLPKLFRLQDPGTGRTMGYLKPDDKFEVVLRVDTIVGVVGEKTFDETLRLHIVTPKRIDVLTPQGSSKPVETVAAGK